MKLHFGTGDDAELARLLRAFAAADGTDGRPQATSCGARRAGHSVDSWADAVVATVRRLHD